MLVMTAVDRYLSVCHPLSSFNTSSKSKVYVMIAFAYALSALLSLPQPIIFKYQEQLADQKVYDCWVDFDPPWTLNLYITSFLVAVYLVPLAILIYTYVSICYAIWQKHKHSQCQYQLGAHEMSKVARSSHNEMNVEVADIRGADTGTGAMPGQRNSSGSRTHSTSSSLDARGGAKFPGNIQSRSLNVGVGGASHRPVSTYIHHHHHRHQHHHYHTNQGGFYKHSSKYCTGPGIRCALVEGRTGMSPSSLLANGRDGRLARSGRGDHGTKRGKGQADNRQFVARSNAIRRRANLVVTTTNGSARSSTGSVRGLSRAKMKTVKLTFVVIVAYVVCWTPFFVSQLWWLYDESQESSKFWTSLPAYTVHSSSSTLPISLSLSSFSNLP